MLTLTSERLPVTVYRSSDSDAPILDRSPNCVATIFKACLVTGYGDKQPAGWTLPFEDNDKGIKVLRPKVGADTDFYLKLSNDTGREIDAQVYTQMSSVDTGTKQLECATPFKYAHGHNSGKWCLIASERGIWFLFEQIYDGDMNQSGGYLFCGDTGKNSRGQKAVYLQHSGGSWNDGGGFDLLNSNGGSGGFVDGHFYDAQTNSTHYINATSFFDAKSEKTQDIFLSPLHLFYEKHIYTLPGIYASSQGALANNFEQYQDKLVFGLSSYQARSNFYFDTKNWIY